MNDSGRVDSTSRGFLRCSKQLADQLEAAADCIRNHDRFLVAAHEEPDGDAAGSTLALALLLEQLGKDVVRFNVDGVPYNFQFLEGADRVTGRVPEEWNPDVTVLLDCSSLDRLGAERPDELEAETQIIVDHHDTFDGESADVALYDPDAAATAELVFRLVRELDAELTDAIAEAIYCAILTDTGSFQYSNTGRSTFRIAGELLEAGVDAWEMTVEVLESQPLRRVELLSDVLETLEVSECGRLAFIRIDRETLGETDRAAELTDGFINYGRSIRGVEVSTRLRELEDGTWKVSFRSKGRVDVAELARRFGGGGHANAAGFRSEAPADEICEQLSRALTELLDDDTS